MLMFRARGFLLRDQFGDVLKGMITREEAIDMPREINLTPDGPQAGEPARIQDTSDLKVTAPEPEPAKPKAPGPEPAPKPATAPGGKPGEPAGDLFNPPTDSDLAVACDVPITVFRDYVKAKGWALTDKARGEILAEPKPTADEINAWADAE